jgi:hypothetical protein
MERTKDQFFDEAMYMVHVTGWPEDHLTPEQAYDSRQGARLAIWPTDPPGASPGHRLQS